MAFNYSHAFMTAMNRNKITVFATGKKKKHYYQLLKWEKNPEKLLRTPN